MSKGVRAGEGGYTLLELVVVLAVLGILSSLSAVALSAVQDSSKLSASTQALSYSLSLGRSEAIKRGGRVVICKSANGLTCAQQGSWEQGWIVFSDLNNNAQVDAGEAVLHGEQALPRGVRVTGNLRVESYVSYTALGHTSQTSGAFQSGTITLCMASQQPGAARQIVIANSGRARIQKTKLPQCA